jgi:tetratricopeptide (TPR) repeat protein
VSDDSGEPAGRQTGARPAPKATGYDAFISYSQRADKAIAQALRSVIQTIGKPWWKVRSLNVFLDAASLSAAPGLWDSIAGKLDRSRYLILLASPEAAKSAWVDREVAHFLREGGQGISHLLIGLTGGELAWNAAGGDFAWDEATPLPPSLRGRFREEPLWVDLRPFRAEPARANKSDQAFLHAALDLAATVKDVEKADLYSDELRQQRRSLRVAYGAAGLVAVLGAGAAAGAWIAVQRAAEATRNFGIARETVDNVVTGIVQDLRDVQGVRVESVQKILTTTQGALDRLFEIAPDDPAVRASRAATLIEIGDTYVAKGDNAGALKVYSDSLALRRELAAGGSNPAEAVDLAVSLARVGYARLNKGELGAAAAALDESIAILRKVTAGAPGAADWQNELAWTVMKKGDVLSAGGDVSAAVALFEEAATIWRQGLPDRPRWRRNLAVLLVNMANARIVLADAAGAAAAFDEALALRRAIFADDRSSGAAEYLVAVTLVDIANFRTSGGDDTAARAAFVEGEAILRRLVETDRGNSDWSNSLATALLRRGILERGEGHSEEARDAFAEAERIYRRLADNDPEKVLWRQNLASVLNRLGYVKLAAGAYDEAVKVFREGAELWRKIVAESDGGGRARFELAGAQISLCEGLNKAEGLAAARPSCEEGLAAYRALVAGQPANRGWMFGLAKALEIYGVLTLAARDYGKAASTFAESSTLFERLVELDRSNVEWASWLAATYADSGDVAYAQEDYATALKRFEESLAIRRETVVRAPKKEWIRRNLAVNLERVAKTRRRLADTAGAVAAYREAVALREAFTEEGNVDRVLELAYARWNLQALLTDDEERVELINDVANALGLLDEDGKLNPDDRGLLRDAIAERDRILARLDGTTKDKPPADFSAGAASPAPDPGDSDD